MHEHIMSESAPLIRNESEDVAYRNATTPTSSKIRRLRNRTVAFLASPYGHYSVLFMVGVDTIGIFATFIIELYLCEHECGKSTGEYSTLYEVQHVLEIISLIFSCLFMLELFLCIFGFGFRYFKSWFHCLDAAVIVIAFVIDVFLQGILEEVGSTVVILRLWRVFKIMDEFSAGAQEQMDVLIDRIKDLEKENAALQATITSSAFDSAER